MQVLTRHSLGTLALLALASWSVGSAAFQGQSQAEARPATAEISVLVKQALEETLEARTLPDINLLRGASRVAVRQEMPRAGIRLGEAALPELTGTTFELQSHAAMQAAADKTGQVQHFITADQPDISADTATVWLGVDAVAPREPKVILLCCCRGLGQFHRSEDRWTWVKWVQMICS